MAEYVKKEDVVDVLRNLWHAKHNGNPVYSAEIDRAITDVHDLEPEDVAPVRHGRWDGGYTKTSDGEWVYSTPKCTVCGSKSNGGTTNFCPYCGCKMLEDSDGKK